MANDMLTVVEGWITSARDYVFDWLNGISPRSAQNSWTNTAFQSFYLRPFFRPGRRNEGKGFKAHLDFEM